MLQEGRTTTGSACLQAGPGRLRHKAHHKIKKKKPLFLGDGLESVSYRQLVVCE